MLPGSNKTLAKLVETSIENCITLGYSPPTRIQVSDHVYKKIARALAKKRLANLIYWEEGGLRGEDEGGRTGTIREFVDDDAAGSASSDDRVDIGGGLEHELAGGTIEAEGLDSSTRVAGTEGLAVEAGIIVGADEEMEGGGGGLICDGRGHEGGHGEGVLHDDWFGEGLGWKRGCLMSI